VIVDSHTHASLAWYEPVETLLFEMDRAQVDRAILIQINGQYDNSYQFACVARHPDRLASVVLVDPSRDDASEALQRLAEQGASGVRLGPTVRSPGDDPLRLWRTAARLGLAVSCGGNSADFASPQFGELVQALPEVTIVVEHLASVSQPSAGGADEDRRLAAFELARFPNVFIKVPGLGEFCRRAQPVSEPFPFAQPIPPYLEHARARFGAERMMWGSDFPPVAGREGYARALRLTMDQFAARPAAERDAIFGDVAQRVFAPRA
jgi:L-fuconolactonase